MSQDYPALEWLILDDSPSPSGIFENPGHPGIHYSHIGKKLTIGEKRNLLVDRASGEIIIHFDDDDFYGPGYVSFMVDSMLEKGADLLNLRGWFLYDVRHRFFGYWNLEVKDGLHYVCNDNGTSPIILSSANNAPLAINHLGYGFGWAYKKAVWQSAPFPDESWNEDGEFALVAQRKFRLDGVQDTQGVCIHVLHPSNISQQCFAQFQLPNFLLPKIFPGFRL
jgi:hypothetical protein